MNPPFAVFGGAGPVMATAIHAGHSLRPEIAARIGLDEATRFREEDPYTEKLSDIVPLGVVVDRSRFEIDLNRPRDQAIYLTPDQAWGLEVWREQLDPETVAVSLDIYDWFYQEVAQQLDVLAAQGPFVVLDVHSYNHRREPIESETREPGGAAIRRARSADHSATTEYVAGDPEANPDVNLGTGSLDRAPWAQLIDHFTDDLREALPPTAIVAENVRFKGGYFSQWVHERYPGRGCALALELKKTFMDEWTGEVNLAHIGRLREALASTLPGVLTELEVVAASQGLAGSGDRQ